MRFLVLTGLAAVGLVSTAFATTTDELKVCVNNANCVVVTDNGVGDSSPAAGEIIYTNNSFFGWNVKAETGDSGSNSNVNPALDLGSLTATCTNASGCATKQLEVYYSDINFDVLTSAGNWDNNFSATITGTSPSAGTAAQYAWVDKSNTLFGQPAGGAVPVNGPYTNPGGAGDTFGGPATTNAPYSVTLEQVFTDNGKKSASGLKFSTDGAISGSGVPEPGAIILFGTVVALCTSRLRRRSA